MIGYGSSCGTPTSHPPCPSPLRRPSVVTTMRANPVTTARSFTCPFYPAQLSQVTSKRNRPRNGRF